MTQRSRVSATIWGALSIVAGALMTEGGAMEVIVYWPQGETANVAVGGLGALASAVLLVSGTAFCTRRSFGRRTAIAGAIGMAPIHLMGWILGLVGVPGVLLGVAYPAVLLLALRAKPDLGAPACTEAGSTGGAQSPPSSHTTQRATVSAT